jgi:DNA-binding GntR family transcriptional regulator
MQPSAGNTPEFIANTLRNAILQGVYQAKEPLRQDRLAEELGVSKIPLREALVQLKAEGLVEFLPKRGAVVSNLSSAEVEEIYLMRIALESVALARAIPRLSQADLIRAESTLKIIDIENDKGRWGELNWEFHTTLYRAAGMPLLLKSIETLHNNVVRYLVIYLDRLSAWEASQKEHWALLEACRVKNHKQASDVLKSHLEQASQQLSAYLA